MDAVNQGQGQSSKELNEEVSKVEEELRRRLPIGWSTSLATLRREFVEGKGFSETSLNRALLILQRKDTIAIRSQGAQIYRSGV
jgi:DNA replication licensing factor MCM5